MYCGGDIIEINEYYRLRIELDTDSPNPLEHWGVCEILTIDNYRMWMGWENLEDPIAYAAREFHLPVRSGKWTEEERDRAIRGYMHMAGDTREFAVYEWRGYSKGDWATVLVLWDPETGANQSEEWGAWLRGDVYGVIEEIRKVYVNPDDPNDVFEDWEDGDSLWGCYLDEGYTAETVAKENFKNYPTKEENKDG